LPTKHRLGSARVRCLLPGLSPPSAAAVADPTCAGPVVSWRRFSDGLDQMLWLIARERVQLGGISNVISAVLKCSESACDGRGGATDASNIPVGIGSLAEGRMLNQVLPAPAWLGREGRPKG
jgi:hypothetical protein